MEYQIEKEYKMILDQKSFNKLISNLTFTSIITQTNHYYSAPNNMGMRIREIDGKYIFTLKHYLNKELREYEFLVPTLDINNDKIKQLFKELNIDSVKYLGYMTTKRYLLNYPKASLCLDESHYLNQVDYELEYELNDASIDDFDNLEALLKKYDLKYKPNNISKYQRFLNAL